MIEAMDQATSERIKTTGFDFVMFMTQDLKRGRTFYESLFGLTPGKFDSENFVEYELEDGNAFALAYYPQGGKMSLGGAMFAVPDVEAAIARAQELGATLLGKFGGEVCDSGWLQDPEGNCFGVHKRR